jgi:guanylate kinase
MTYDGVILYGPPASGKDSVTAALCGISDAYAYFEKLKLGEGRTRGYHFISEASLADLRNRGLIVHEVTRYGATYVVDGPRLDELFAAGRVPVVHMGQVEGVNALRLHTARWLDVLLWCSRDVAAERLLTRGSVDVDERLAAWDATLDDLGSATEPQFTLSIRTEVVTPATVAALIHAVMTAPSSG